MLLSYFFLTCLCVTVAICSPNNSLSLILRKNETFSELSFEERKSIEKVKEFANDSLYRDYMKTDKYLIRWVRDANLDPVKASEKIKEIHMLRKENKIDNILSEDWKKFETNYPFEIIDGFDLEGDPIITIGIGQWDIRKALIIGESQKLYRYIHYIFEKSDEFIRQTKSINATAIINMNGFSTRTHICLGCIPIYLHIANILENHYPQICKHLYIINTPRYFQPILDLTEPLLTSHTRKVYKVFGYDKSEWVPIVLRKIPPHLLSTEYGGTRKPTERS